MIFSSLKNLTNQRLNYSNFAPTDNFLCVLGMETMDWRETSRAIGWSAKWLLHFVRGITMHSRGSIMCATTTQW